MNFRMKFDIYIIPTGSRVYGDTYSVEIFLPPVNSILKCGYH